MFEIVLSNTKEPQHEFEITEVTLTTESGINFNLQIVNGFMNINQINKRALSNVVIVELPLSVKTNRGTYQSNEPVVMLFAHGYRDQSKRHVVLNDGINSEEIVRAVVNYLGTNNQKRLKVIISCDSDTDGVKTRWDQSTIGRRLGVVGFSGATNSATTDAETKSVIVTVQEEMGPHAFQPSSSSAWMVSDSFKFIPKD